MSAGIAVPLEEYLAHTYEPDCEYVDGQIVERNVGEYFHSLFQITLGTYLVLLQASGSYSFRAVVECRARVRGGDDTRRRYRIPDLSIVPLRSAPTSIILEPPLAVVEILSPEDRFNSVVQKCSDYEAFGVPEIWIVDPLTKEIWTVRNGEAIPVPDRITSFTCNEGEVRVDFNEVFANPHLN
jgi:Uma2 family endonuclease